MKDAVPREKVVRKPKWKRKCQEKSDVFPHYVEVTDSGAYVDQRAATHGSLEGLVSLEDSWMKKSVASEMW